MDSTSGLEQDVAQLNIAEQNWNPGQPSFLQPRELRGMPNHIHMGAGPPPQFNRMEEMGVQGGRAKRYSSQRQRPVPEPPAPPVHISIMEGHYYDPLQFQGPIYTHGDSPAPLPPQGMIVQPEMHLPIQVYIPTRRQRLCPIRASIPHQCLCLPDSHHLSSCLLPLTFLPQES